ncbi:MAG: Flp pilus assembly protein CpaB [Acidobacteriaceae bacterium]|nr:Flp pilus assembly protein CpaB [Acidobacteriaceae bacterium]
MNRRLATVLFSAFAVAAICSYLVYRVIGNRLGAVQPKTTQVIVAATDIKLGSLLRDVDLSTADFVGSLPKGAILKKADAIGRGVVSNLYQGEPIIDSRLAAAGSGGGLAATIRQGMRACAVKVDEVVGVAGFVTPGMRVDVLISGNPPGPVNPAEGPKVRTLFQNVEVLSAGTDIQKDNEGKPQQVQVVNLLVTPEQAELLSLASTQAHIQLVLRNPLDTQTAQLSGSAVTQLYADPNAKPALKPLAFPRRVTRPVQSQLYVIEVFNGSKRSEEKFAAAEGKQ